jgi:S-DNA-T family DNA segregation ATPase FtsK/SpoIIIE
MATQAMAGGATGASGVQRGSAPDWRAALRRSLRRSAEIGGAAALFAAMLFLAVALATYEQTDPSMSTAAGGAVQNWMGPAGAWAAERALFLFGPVSVLFLPLLYVMARRLWRLVEEEDGAVLPYDPHWWRPIGVLLFAMALLATVLSLAFTQPGGSLPATMGGISGLLGAKAVRALAALLPEAARGWAILAAAMACLVAGAVLASRVFALSWGTLLTLPGALRGRRALPAPDAAP